MRDVERVHVGETEQFIDKLCYHCFKNDFFKTEEYFLFKKNTHLKICCHNLKFSTINEIQKKNSKIKNVQGYSLNFMNGRSSDMLWGNILTLFQTKFNLK